MVYCFTEDYKFIYDMIEKNESTYISDRECYLNFFDNKNEYLRNNIYLSKVYDMFIKK